MTETQGCILVSTFVALIVIFLTGCAGFEMRVGFAGYNENEESRKFVNEAGVQQEKY